MNGCSLDEVIKNNRTVGSWAVIFYAALLFTFYRICKGDNIQNSIYKQTYICKTDFHTTYPLCVIFAKGQLRQYPELSYL